MALNKSSIVFTVQDYLNNRKSIYLFSCETNETKGKQIT
jgi:hypothetical protein